MQGIEVFEAKRYRGENSHRDEGNKRTDVICPGPHRPIGTEMWTGAMMNISSSSDCDEIFFCVSGQAHCSIDPTLAIKDGDVIWSPRGHQMKLSGTGSTLRVYFNASEKAGAQRLCQESRTVETPLCRQKSSLRFLPWGSPDSGRLEMGIYIGRELSATLGCAMCILDHASVPTTLGYHELIMVISGQLRISTPQKTWTANTGDIMWVPSGTEIRYDGDHAEFFTAIYPMDWREHQLSATPA